MTNEELLKLAPGYYWVKRSKWEILEWYGSHAHIIGYGPPLMGYDLEDWEWNLDPIEPPT